MAKTQTTVGIHARFKMKEPAMYNVVMHNDDVTTMDFVVMVLERIFRKSEVDAETIMLKIHNEGAAIVGKYYMDIAKSKAEYTMRLARQNGYPLMLTVEEE